MVTPVRCVFTLAMPVVSHEGVTAANAVPHAARFILGSDPCFSSVLIPAFTTGFTTLRSIDKEATSSPIR